MAKMYKTIAELMAGTGITEDEAKALWVQGIKIPKLKHRWRISATGAMSEFDLALQITSCERPVATFEEIEIPPNTTANPSHRPMRVAGKMSWSPISMIFTDDARGDAARVIQKQMMLQMNDDCGDSKFDLFIEYLDGNGDVTDKWVIEGCFLQTINYTSLDYSVSEVVEFELIVCFDHAHMEG